MVDHFLRLKLALLASAFRPGATLARTLGALVLAGAVAVGMVLLATEVDLSLDSHRAALVIVATAIAMGIAVAPLSAGLGSAMEPRRFVSFGIEPRRLALGLGAAAAIGVPGILAALLGISLEIAWAGSPTAAAAVVAGVLGAISIVIVSQYLVVVGAQLSTSTSARRAVTAAARLVIVIALACAALTVVTVQLDPDDATLVGVAAWLANTPLGMLWAAPGSDTAALFARLLAGAVMVAVLALGWGWIVSRLLETPVRSRADSTSTGLGWFDLVPATASGVVAARSLLYWTSDPRYRFVLIGLPLAPIFMMLALATAGSPLPPLWLLPLPVLAFFLGWFNHNDVAYDHTAVWLHVAAPMRGTADRWGRAVPPLLIGTPLILALAPVFALWSGVDDVLPALIGVSMGLLLTGLGVSSVTSAISAYPAARPGAGAFEQPPTQGTRAGWTQALSLIATLSLMTPTFVVTWWATLDASWYVTAGVSGLATGAGVLLLGILAGGRAFRRRAPELLDLVMRG